MNKLFRVEEGNVLRLDEPRPDPDDYEIEDKWFADVSRWRNRESYPYVAEGWKVGETKELNIDFVLRPHSPYFESQEDYDLAVYESQSELPPQQLELFAIPIKQTEFERWKNSPVVGEPTISKPKKED